LEKRALAELEVAGLRTLGQFAAAPLDALVTVLGRGALPLQRRAQGVSEEPVGKKRAVEPGWVERIEFEEDVWEEEFLLATLRRMLERLMAQVRGAGVEVRRLVLGIRYTDREEARRTVDLAEPTALEAETWHLLPELLKGAWTRRVRLRALELRAARVYRPTAQMDLFAPAQEKREQWMKLAGVIDGLRRRHGAGIVLRCDELGKKTA
jgi:DNA polymerase-4